MRFKTIIRLQGIIFLWGAISLASCSSSKKSGGKGNVGGNTPVSLQKKYAGLLGVPASDITNTRLYAFIDKWMDTRYQYGGQSSKGFDCSGFSQKLYDEVYSIKIPRTSQDQYKALEKFHRRKNLEEGDLLFFATAGGKRISHVGVYLQNNKFINATTSKGVVISDLTSKYWDDCYIDGGAVR